MQSWRQIAFSREGIQEGSSKLHRPVHIGEVRDQTERDSHRTTTLHPQISEQCIPAHAPFTLEELWQRFLRFLMKDLPQGFL